MTHSKYGDIGPDVFVGIIFASGNPKYEIRRSETRGMDVQVVPSYNISMKGVEHTGGPGAATATRLSHLTRWYAMRVSVNTDVTLKAAGPTGKWT